MKRSADDLVGCCADLGKDKTQDTTGQLHGVFMDIDEWFCPWGGS